MAYKLKTTGVATKFTTVLAVDPDTGTLKDFASALVTADMVVGANVTIASQAWDGNTRHYWMPGAGTADADFVKFGTNKPRWEFNVNDQVRTVVWIGETAGTSVRLFGSGTTQYVASQNLGGGGNSFPCVSGCGWAVPEDGGLVRPAAGQKWIFGFSARHGAGAGFTTAFAALHDAASMTVVTDLDVATITNTSANFDLLYVNRRNDSTVHQQDKSHVLLLGDEDLTEAELNSLRDDWFGTLLEEEAVAYTLTADPGAYSLTGQAATLTYTAAGQVLTGEAGGFTITGAAAGLRKGYKLQAEAGSFTLDGEDAARDMVMSAGAGSFGLTGNDATLTYTAAAGSYTLTAETGVFTLTGQSAGVAVGHKLPASAGSFILDGQAAAFAFSRKLPAAAGSFTFSGQDATFALDANTYTLTAEAGAFVLSGIAATLTSSAVAVRVLSAAPSGRRLSTTSRPRNLSTRTR